MSQITTANAIATTADPISGHAYLLVIQARLGRGVRRRGAGNRPDARRSLRSRVRGRRRLIREDGLAGRPRARAGQRRHTIAAVGFLDRLTGRTEPDTRDDGDWFTLCAASIQSVVGESGYQPCLDKTVRGATPPRPSRSTSGRVTFRRRRGCRGSPRTCNASRTTRTTRTRSPSRANTGSSATSFPPPPLGRSIAKKRESSRCQGHAGARDPRRRAERSHHHVAAPFHLPGSPVAKTPRRSDRSVTPVSGIGASRWQLSGATGRWAAST